jgi:hypothetical protein
MPSYLAATARQEPSQPTGPCHQRPDRAVNRPRESGDPPIPPQRRRSVPIANEDRLVVPDTLGTTIRLSFLERPARLAPADCSQRDRCCHLYIGSAGRDVPRALPLPIPGFQSSDRFTVATASQGLGAWLRNVNAAAGPSALAGTPLPTRSGSRLRRLRSRAHADHLLYLVCPICGRGAGRGGGLQCGDWLAWRWGGEGSLCSGRSYRRPGVVGDRLVRAAD